MRRRQTSSVIQRREAFNEAADAAISQALSQRAAAAAPTQASDLASESAQDAAVAKPEADVSHHVVPGSVPQQASHVGHVPPAVQLEQANHVTASDQSQRSSSTQALPSGRTGSGLQPENPAGIKRDKHEEEQDAPKLVTRTSQAEVAPKLKTGSRLAASMAKLAASKKAGDGQADVAAPAAVAAPLPPKDDGKKSAIPEDIKHALLAKVNGFSLDGLLATQLLLHQFHVTQTLVDPLDDGCFQVANAFTVAIMGCTSSLSVVFGAASLP